MSIGTLVPFKVKLYFGLIVSVMILGMTFVSAGGSWPLPKPNGHDKLEKVVITIAFNPRLRNPHEIHSIRYSVNGEQKGPFRAHISPWHRTLMVARGSIIELEGSQGVMDRKKSITCLVHVVGNSKFDDSDIRFGLARVNCNTRIPQYKVGQ